MERMERIACLCPTYKRPAALLANAIACFERQSYPAQYRRLIVLDDSGTLARQGGNSWDIYIESKRYPSLPAKYNRLREMASDADILVVWEDDDSYLPWHLSAHHLALADHEWSHPTTIISTYGGIEPHIEPAAGRFHAALALRASCMDAVGGWPQTLRGDFDQQLLGKLRRYSKGDPCDHPAGPSYVFRWESTGSYHGQAQMTTADDCKWYERAGLIADRLAVQRNQITILPELDPETRKLTRMLERPWHSNDEGKATR